MRKSLLSLAAVAGLAGAVAAPLVTPTKAASLAPSPSVQASSTASVTPAIAGPGETATVQKVYWVWVRPGYRVWRPGPAVVVRPAGPVWWWHGRYWYHRGWGPHGWNYW